MNKQELILNELKNLLTIQYGKAFEDAILFGSQLNSIEKDDSDYDILVILNQTISGKDEDSIYNLCYNLNLKHNIVLDIHLLSNNDIESIRGKQPIYNNALQTGLHA